MSAHFHIQYNRVKKWALSAYWYSSMANRCAWSANHWLISKSGLITPIPVKDALSYSGTSDCVEPQHLEKELLTFVKYGLYLIPDGGDIKFNEFVFLCFIVCLSFSFSCLNIARIKLRIDYDLVSILLLQPLFHVCHLITFMCTTGQYHFAHRIFNKYWHFLLFSSLWQSCLKASEGCWSWGLPFDLHDVLFAPNRKEQSLWYLASADSKTHSDWIKTGTHFPVILDVLCCSNNTFSFWECFI